MVNYGVGRYGGMKAVAEGDILVEQTLGNADNVLSTGLAETRLQLRRGSGTSEEWR
jgi:hypothetical protein